MTCCSLGGVSTGSTTGTSGLGPLDEGDGVADGLEVLDLVVGDGDAELLLGGDDDLDHGQRVHVQVVDEGLVQLNVVGVDAGDLVDDVGEVGADLLGGCHVTLSFLAALMGLRWVFEWCWWWCGTRGR